MISTRTRVLLASLAVMTVAACSDSPLAMPEGGSLARGPVAQQDLAFLFQKASPVVLGLPNTVFADHDEVGNKLRFGVENASAANGVRNALTAMGIPASSFEVVITEPFEFKGSLTTDANRIGGNQIQFVSKAFLYSCTLGFNVDHAGGRSFITNSHCTSKQGELDGTQYYSPAYTRNAADVFATEAADPTYNKAGCSAGKICRYSDASRAVYAGNVSSTRGLISKTDGQNTGSLTTIGAFTIRAQDATTDHFGPGTLNKVGRTTGWTSGAVGATCANINVQGAKFQLLCQTIVNGAAGIVDSGDSGSPVFSLSGDDATLVGILWGGNNANTQFIFSPLKNIVQELGSVTATAP
jgi:hypothetical protein